MHKALLSLAVVVLVLPASVLAYGKRPIGATRTMSRGSTTAMFIDKQIWLPGKWTVKQETEAVTITRKHMDGIHTSSVRLSVIPRDQCGYGYVRIRALKAWGGRFLEQAQGRVQPVSFGSSKFKGYTWTQPTTWEGNAHWCVAQDLKTAFELVVTQGDHDLMTFVRNDLLLQLINRSGRSVLPWPSASGMSSSSSSSSSSVQ